VGEGTLGSIALDHLFFELITASLQFCGGLSCRGFFSQQFFVFLINILNILLVFNLERMEVNEFQIVAHFFLVFDLGLGLADRHAEGDVLGLEFIDQRLFLLQLVHHVLGQLFSVVLSNAAVFCG